MTHLEIKASTLSPSSVEILIDGRKVEGIKSLKLDMGVGKLHTAEISFYAEKINIDAEVLARFNEEEPIDGDVTCLGEDYRNWIKK